MTAGGTGMTETELHAAGIDFRKVYTHQNGHASYYPGTSPLFLKVLFDPAEGKLLGAQVLGWDGVDKRIDVLAVALRAGMTVYDLENLELAYAPPYGSAKDPVNMAGFLGANLLRGDIHLWYPEDVPGLRRPRDDPRCAYAGGVRRLAHPRRRSSSRTRSCVRRLDEVPRDKPVYTYCRSGFRSYIAYCVLKQNGWKDVAFLSGGMMTYPRLPQDAADDRQGRHAGRDEPRRGRAGRAPRRAPDVRRTGSPRARAASASWVTLPVEVALNVRAQHGEGPLWDAATARLWWVDIAGRRVHCFDPRVGRRHAPGAPPANRAA